jgi:hypothetical protein
VVKGEDTCLLSNGQWTALIRAARAPDGVAFARAAIRCEKDAVILFVPDTAVVRLKRRYPEHDDVWQELLADTPSADMEAALILRWDRVSGPGDRSRHH